MIWTNILNGQSDRSFDVVAIPSLTEMLSTDIYCMLQDKDGYIWVGTRSGISRFDGHSFVHFSFRDSPNLVKINALEEDSSGRIWAGGAHGLFYIDDLEVHPVTQFDKHITALHFDEEGTLFVAGLTFVPFRITKQNQARICSGNDFEVYPLIERHKWDKVVKSQRVWEVKSDPGGGIWLGLDFQLLQISGDTIREVWATQEKEMIDEIVPVAFDSVFFGSETMGLHLLTGRNRVVRQTMPATSISFRSDSALYFLTTMELVKLQNNQWDTLHRFSEYANLYFKDMVMDQEGNFFIGAEGNLIMLTAGFMDVQTREDNSLLESNHTVTTLRNGQILIGKGGQKILQVTDHQPTIYANLPVPNNSVTEAIYQDHDGHLWFGTTMAGIIYAEDDNFKIFDPSNGLFDTEVQFFRHFSDSSFWCGGYEGISRIRKDGDTVEFENYPVHGSHNEVPVFFDMVAGPDDRLWAISQNGIFEVRSGALSEFQLRESALPVFSSVVTQEDGDFWLGTQGMGLWKIGFDDNNDPTVDRVFGKKDGMLSDVVLGVAMDSLHQLWVFHQYGFCQLDPDSDVPVNQCFTREDGWPQEPASKIRITNDPLGEMWVVTTTALIRFNPYDLPQNDYRPKTFISGITLPNNDGDMARYKTDTKDEMYCFPANRNFLVFDYHGTTFTSPDKVTYRYKLEGLSDEWYGPVSGRSARFAGLKPGMYTFHVQAYNSSGVAGLMATPVTFRIKTPLLLRWWAQMVYVLLAGTVGYYLIRLYLRQKEREQEALRLRELDQLKSSLYTNVTHEFRTPLTVISGLTDQLRSWVNTEHLPKLDLIQNNTQKLLQLVNRMLDLSKVQSGKMDVHFEQMDIVSYMAYLVESQYAFAELNKVNMQFHPEMEAFPMDVDREKLEQIISNLLTNAIKYTPAGGKVEVRLNRTEQEIHILIQDTGIGIAEHELPFIFDRFHRLENSEGRDGSGIGLALVNELVSVLGGRIEASSKLRSGTIFHLFLPVSHEANALGSIPVVASTPALPMSVRNGDARSQKDLPLILLAEDNPDVAYYIKSCLAAHYNVIHSHNGKKALARSFTEIPDLVISDIMMPEMDGLEFCQALKRDLRTDHIPVILLTARASIQDRITGVRTGADVYLTKPFHQEELLAQVDRLLKVRAFLQKKYSAYPTGEHSQQHEVDPFVTKVEQTVMDNLQNDQFSLEALCQELHLSQSQVYRKLKALTGMSTAVFVRHVRLRKAHQLLKDPSLSVSDVAFACGFGSLAYFSQSFKEAFGESPSDFRNSILV